MAVQLLGLRTKFTDDQGRPLVGGKVHAYFAGTTTYQDTFKDPDMTIVNTNPIILDDSGSADVYLNGSYRIRIFDKNDVLIEEQDGVTQSASGEITTAKGEIIGLYGAVLNSLTNEVKRAVAAEKNIADSLTSETTRAKAAESALQSSIDAETTRAKAAESDLNANIIKEVSDRESEVVRLDEADAVLQAQINSVGGGKLAYKTYAEMIADKSNIAAKSSIDIIADTDDKNGTYLYDGANFVKSNYDLEKIIRAKVQNTFGTYAQMIASNLSDGAYALVADDTNDKNGIYIKHCGKWSKSVYAPIIESSDKFGWVFAVLDSVGNVGAGVDTDGVAHIAKANIASREIDNKHIQDYDFCYKDSQGNAALGIKKDGTFVVGKIEADEYVGLTHVTSDVPHDTKPAQLTNIMHIDCFGQSLSIGAYSTPIQNPTQEYNNIMFQGGVINQHPLDKSVDFRGAFVPLHEGKSADSYPANETPVTASTNVIRQLLIDEDGLRHTDHDLRFLGTASGEGGYSVESLSGAPLKNNLKPNIDAAYQLAQAEGKTYSIPAIYWVQGEQDNNLESQTIEGYKKQCRALFDEISQHAKSVTGQDRQLQVISTQLIDFAKSTTGSKTTPKVELALWEMANELDYFHLACPLYICNTVSDGTHLTGESSALIGMYLGLVFKRVVIDGKGWSHIKPISHTVQGNILEVKFHVPVKPLVFDTDYLAENTNYGFSMVDSSVSQVVINKIDITQPDTVRFVLSKSPKGCTLRYAFHPAPYTAGLNTRARGNLRDSQGDTITHKGHALHNWTPLFQYSII